MAKATNKQTKIKKVTAAKTAPADAPKPKQPGYTSFRLSKRIKAEKLPGGFRLFREALDVLVRR